MSFAAFAQAYSADYQTGQANRIKAEGLAVTVNGRIWMSTHVPEDERTRLPAWTA